MASFESVSELAFFWGFLICSCGFGYKNLLKYFFYNFYSLFRCWRQNPFDSIYYFWFWFCLKKHTYFNWHNYFNWHKRHSYFYFNWFKLGFLPSFSLLFSIHSSFYGQLVNCQLHICSFFSFSYFIIFFYLFIFFRQSSFVCTFFSFCII